MPSDKFYNYIQTVIGDCGHLCDGWPLFNNEVICDVCTAEKYSLDEIELEGLTHWVRRSKTEKLGYTDAKKVAKAPRKRAPKRQPGTPLRQDGLW